MAIAGIRTRFSLATTPGGEPVDISHFLDGVSGSSDTDELDGTTFQPDAVVPIKDIIPGFSTKGLDLSGKYTPEADQFFTPLEGQQGLPYEYQPAGSGHTISGEASVFSYTGPQSTVDGITTFSVTLRVAARNITPAGSP